MSYTISNAQTNLAYRLGESQSPTATAEKNRRQAWMVEGLQEILKKRPFWFLQKVTTDNTVANVPNYDVPSDFRQEIAIYVDGYKYDKIEQEDTEEYRSNLQPVSMFSTTQSYKYYIWGEDFYLIPTPTSAPTAQTLTSITSSSTTATATLADHGYYTNDYVTIAGANESAYNGKFQITKVDDDSFTYTMASDPDDTATGTLTATKSNIEIWYFYEPTLPTGDSSSIVIPDKYMNVLVSYAEARFWSAAHKRAKASDAFTEFENIVDDMIKEDVRRNFLTGTYRSSNYNIGVR